MKTLVSATAMNAGNVTKGSFLTTTSVIALAPKKSSALMDLFTMQKSVIAFARGIEFAKIQRFLMN
jgi:hypothetical protein